HRAERDHRQSIGVAPAPIEFRYSLEVHAVNARDQRGRHTHDRDDRQHLDDVVLLDIDQPQGRVEQQLDLIYEVRVVIAERGDILAQRIETPLDFGRQPLGARAGDIGGDPAHPEQAVANLRDEIAITADAAQDYPKIRAFAGGR